MLHKTFRTLLMIALVLMSFSAVAAQDDTYTLGMSISTLNNPFFVTLRDGAQSAANGMENVELVVLDSQNDSATEAANVEDLIAQGVDAILINPTDGAAVVPSILAANDAGIPVFTIDRSAEEGEVVSHIASDNATGGRMAAEYLCNAIGGSGNVVELQGIPGTSAARDRGQGFNDYMSSECGDAEIVAQQPANFDRAEGLTVYENILQSQDSVAGTFAHNDSMILGALEAAEAAGRAEDTVFVGFDAIDDAVQAVREGRLDATIAQQPGLMGELGVETAVAHLDGEDVSADIPVELRLISTADGTVTLGMSISTLNNPFFVTLRDGAQAAADSLDNVELVVLDSQNDSATEAANVEDLIAQGVDVILINPTDSAAVVPSILAANDAGIPVFTIDRSAEEGEVVSHIASDNVAGGRLAGEFLCEAIGSSGNVVELQGIPGTSAARDRGQGFNDYMSSECGDAEIVAQQPANFDRAEGLTVYENILQSQDSVAGTFAHNDSMILGAIEAAQAADRAEGTVFVGFDAIDDALTAIQDGALDATVAQQPGLMGELGVNTALDYIIGVGIADSIPVELRLVTEDNVSEFTE